MKVNKQLLKVFSRVSFPITIAICHRGSIGVSARTRLQLSTAKVERELAENRGSDPMPSCLHKNKVEDFDNQFLRHLSTPFGRTSNEFQVEPEHLLVCA